MATPWLDDLNVPQRQAVTCGDGPLLIIAGAGTGKTRTLASRVAHLISQGVPPERMLLLTFTRRAAAEMLRRAGRVTDPDATARVWGGTFHAIANRLLRIYGRALNLPADFTVMDEGDAADLISLIRNELGLADRKKRFPKKRTLLSIYSRMVNAQEPLSETLDTHFPWCARHAEAITPVFDGYVQRKQERHLLDYDDLLLFWSALCATPRVGDAVADRFQHILVDEYQDTNAVQAEILRGMRKSCRNICVVGDDAQSIYAFRAATIRNILDFPKQFPGTSVVTLEQNYRSIQPILDAANAVMDCASQRYTKNLWSERRSEQKPILVNCRDETSQSEAVCQHILDHLEQGRPLMSQAVLFRASHHSAQLEIELTRRNIPFHKFGGLKFVETAHIKDMLAMLRVLENPFDEISWFRLLQLLDGIGPRTARRVMDQLGVRFVGRTSGEGEGTGADASAEADDVDDDRVSKSIPMTPLMRLIAAPPAVPPAAREQFGQLRAALAECYGLRVSEAADEGRSPDLERGKEPPLVTQVERVRHFYEPIFERLYDNPTVRIRDIEQLSQIAAGYRSRIRFITELTLDPPRATSDLAQAPFLEEDWLTLSTIHSAKGCEWTVVHIIHAADGMIPSDMAVGDEAGVEEERRLFYVAMTRAKDMLYIYFPLRYYHRRFGLSDAHNYAQLTRFLPEELLHLFEVRMADAGAEADDWDDAEPGVSDDDQAGVRRDPYGRVSRLWKE